MTRKLTRREAIEQLEAEGRDMSEVPAPRSTSPRYRIYDVMRELERLTAAQLAALADVSTSTVYHEAKRGSVLTKAGTRFYTKGHVRRVGYNAMKATLGEHGAEEAAKRQPLKVKRVGLEVLRAQ